MRDLTFKITHKCPFFYTLPTPVSRCYLWMAPNARSYLDTAGVADIVGIHHDFEGRIGDVFAAAFDRHQMFAHLPGCEGNAGVACKLDEIDENQKDCGTER